jgi:hypothetical protein
VRVSDAFRPDHAGISDIVSDLVGDIQPDLGDVVAVKMPNDGSVSDPIHLREAQERVDREAVSDPEEDEQMAFHAYSETSGEE